MNRSGQGQPLSNRAVSDPARPRLIFFGMACAASAPPLRACLDAGFDIRAVVLPGSTSCATPADGGGAFGDLAAAHGIPVWSVADLRDPALPAALAALDPDLIVVACFPWRVPASVRTLPRFGCVNVHPSLLPAGRGPEPVFWTLRRGERQTGVTLHLLDAGWDTGPILAQATLSVPEGVCAPALEHQLMALGGELLVQTIPALLRGEARPIPQTDAHASRAPFPGPADLVVPTNLPARWAYDFVRGVAPLGYPLTLSVLATGDRLPIADARSFSPDDTLPEPIVSEGDTLRVRFRPGVVVFRR